MIIKGKRPLAFVARRGERCHEESESYTPSRNVGANRSLLKVPIAGHFLEVGRSRNVFRGGFDIC